MKSRACGQYCARHVVDVGRGQAAQPPATSTRGICDRGHRVYVHCIGHGFAFSPSRTSVHLVAVCLSLDAAPGILLVLSLSPPPLFFLSFLSFLSTRPCRRCLVRTSNSLGDLVEQSRRAIFLPDRLCRRRRCFIGCRRCSGLIILSCPLLPRSPDVRYCEA